MGKARRSIRRATATALGAVLGLSVAVGVGSPAQADDDYPYKWTGQCKVVDLNAQVPLAPGEEPRPLRLGCEKRLWYVDGNWADPWGFALRNCTSFVAWRLRTTNGIYDFANTSRGWRWGNAEHWDETAKVLGYRVDDIPAVGAVAQSDRGRVGHVAWVSEVHDDGSVTIEEYNSLVAGGYSTQRVPSTEFRYLHLQDLAPGPQVGSQRRVVTAFDQDGRRWTARITADGNLRVAGEGAKATRLGRRGAWSTNASPALLVDGDTQIQVAAITSDGRLRLASTTETSTTGTSTTGTSTTWSRPRTLGRSYSTDASPSLTSDDEGFLRLVATKEAGDLIVRDFDGADWGKPARLGEAGAWSPHASAAVATDLSGRTWVAAITRTGSLQYSFANASQSDWSEVYYADLKTYSTYVSPTMSVAADGRMWLGAVTTEGRLLVRHHVNDARILGEARRLPGRWSAYSSPATGVDTRGRLWLAATDAAGTQRLARLKGQRFRLTALRVASEVSTNPTLIPRRDALTLHTR